MINKVDKYPYKLYGLTHDSNKNEVEVFIDAFSTKEEANTVAIDKGYFHDRIIIKEVRFDDDGDHLMNELRLSDNTISEIETIADMKEITIKEAMERVLNNQSHKELQMLKDVRTAIRNVRRKKGLK